MVVITRFEDYLAHHGIKGQKWGVKNGPPYPLKESAHSSAEKAAGAGHTQAGSVEYLVAYTVATAAYVGLKKLAVNAAEKRRTQQYDEEYYQKRKIKSLDECPKINPSSMSMDDHMKAVNPDYPNLGSTQNCMFCTTAMAMRMKGYDVSAEKCPSGWSSNTLSSTWKDFKSETPKKSKLSDLENYIKEQGDGAYGNFIVHWSAGGGHSMFYHVDNGEVKIYDTQANKMRRVRDFQGIINTSSTEICRLDDKEPTEMALGAVKKRGE